MLLNGAVLFGLAVYEYVSALGSGQCECAVKKNVRYEDGPYMCKMGSQIEFVYSIHNFYTTYMHVSCASGAFMSLSITACVAIQAIVKHASAWKLVWVSSILGHFTFDTSECLCGKKCTALFCGYAPFVHEAPGLSLSTFFSPGENTENWEIVIGVKTFLFLRVIYTPETLNEQLLNQCVDVKTCAKSYT